MNAHDGFASRLGFRRTHGALVDGDHPDATADLGTDTGEIATTTGSPGREEVSC